MMAHLTDILAFAWPGQAWSCTAHDDLAAAYETLNWRKDNPSPKPTLAEVEAQAEAAEAHLADLARRRRRAEALLAEPDRLLTALDAITAAIVELAGKAQVRSGQALDPALQQAVAALRAEIDAAKSVR